MKKFTLGILALFAVMAFNSHANAQLRIGVNVNIGAQPGWGPAAYDEAQYYYLPDYECYYYVPARQFVYLTNGRWTFGASLPTSYGYYDFNSCYKVAVNRPYAYNYFDQDRERYGRYRNYSGQGYQDDHAYRERGWSRDDDEGDHGWKGRGDNGWGDHHDNGRKVGHWKHNHDD